MILERFTKQPEEFKDYDIDYAPWLASDAADTLDDVRAEVVCLTDPDDTELTVESIQITTRVCKLWVKGGTDGYKYKITLFASTVVGRIDESELIFKIKDY